MINIKNYLDSTYLKTPEQAGISEKETQEKVLELTKEAIENGFFAVMIRPDYVKLVKDYITKENAPVKVGTVIGFHEGNGTAQQKYDEAWKAIDDGADELDFVINFRAYLAGDVAQVHDEVVKCTALALEHGKIAKWIIEIAALNDQQIADITSKIAEWATENFPAEVSRIFVKSSTGFYQTENGKPNGATPEGIRIMIDHAGKLPVKAAGGVRSPEEALAMIEMGVQRIGTSSAKALAGSDQSATHDAY